MNKKPLPPEQSIILPLPSIVDRLDLAALFPRSQSLEVELGSGDGSFLIQYATAHPDTNFIGVERLLGRIRKIDRRSHRAGLENIRLVRLEAAYVLEFLLPKHSAQAIHVYFPDPWPKRKHRKNRLINERFVELAREALQPGGIVYLRTDDADYFSQMNSVFGASSSFQESPTPASLSALQTDFERTFVARGIITLRTAWRLR